MINAFPFDSRITGYDADGMPQYDHASNAEEFARLLASFLRSGVFGAEMCEVIADTGMYATVGVGNALLEGRYAYISAAESVLFEVAGTQPRIDTVVLRRDLSSDVNDVVCAVVKGTEAASPVRPALTRDGTVWELGLADVLIPANSTAVSQQNITDTRLEDERCGLVAAILTDVDTTHLYDQISAELAHFKGVEEAEFQAWFESIKGLLEGDVATSLANEISVLSVEVDKKASGVQAQISLSTTGWAGSGPYSITVDVQGMTADAAVVVSPAAESFADYAECVVRATSQGDGTLTFAAEAVPETALNVNVLMLALGVTA